MPKLSESTKETSSHFFSESTLIQNMAERAHREELEAINLPWWKRDYSREELDI